MSPDNSSKPTSSAQLNSNVRVQCPKRVGLVSLLSGVLAVPLAGFAVYLRSIRVLGSARVLDWLDSLGFVKQLPPEAPSIIVNLKQQRPVADARL